MTNDPLAPLLELPGVTEAVNQARGAADSLLAHRALRRRSADVSAESSLRGAWASAALAGVDVDLADLRAGQGVDDPTIQGTLRTYAAIGALADTWPRAPRQALARLHLLAGADLVSDRAVLGRPQPSAADRLDVLTTVLATTSAPAVVVSAVVHGEVFAQDAFPPVSGIVARAAARLVLIERGLDPKSLVVIEAGHRELAEQYATSLAAYRSGEPEGVAQWVRHCANAVVVGARESIAICEALVRQ